jgi:hypothetical protein
MDEFLPRTVTLYYAKVSKIQDAAVKSLVQARFGDKVVSYDRSDPEANKLAVSKGYQVIHGGTLSGDESNNVKRAGTLLPAGKVTPSPKPYSSGGRPEVLVDPSDWTTEMSGTAHYVRELARCLIGRDIEVSICREPSVSWLANYGPGLLTLNIGRLLVLRDWKCSNERNRSSTNSGTNTLEITCPRRITMRYVISGRE